RLLLVDSQFSRTALELAERSRIRQIISFGEALGTTPFEELLMPSPDGNGYSPARGLFDNGILGYETTGDGILTTLYPHSDLMARFSELRARLEPTSEDVV